MTDPKKNSSNHGSSTKRQYHSRPESSSEKQHHSKPESSSKKQHHSEPESSSKRQPHSKPESSSKKQPHSKHGDREDPGSQQHRTESAGASPHKKLSEQEKQKQLETRAILREDKRRDLKLPRTVDPNYCHPEAIYSEKPKASPLPPSGPSYGPPKSHEFQVGDWVGIPADQRSESSISIEANRKNRAFNGQYLAPAHHHPDPNNIKNFVRPEWDKPGGFKAGVSDHVPFDHKPPSETFITEVTHATFAEKRIDSQDDLSMTQATQTETWLMTDSLSIVKPDDLARRDRTVTRQAQGTERQNSGEAQDLKRPQYSDGDADIVYKGAPARTRRERKREREGDRRRDGGGKTPDQTDRQAWFRKEMKDALRRQKAMAHASGRRKNKVMYKPMEPALRRKKDKQPSTGQARGVFLVHSND
ncbi:hypothetical protein GGR57DRAFT_502609 [Xylariaceae sp. FL1272]|nr:hypothetical protein GGR57DRAFT_502609 [Xylariaceae sp. FL1272]